MTWTCRAAAGMATFVLLASGPAGAAPEPCPGTFFCELIVGDSGVWFEAFDFDDRQTLGELDAWVVGGVGHIETQARFLYDRVTGEQVKPLDASAQQDPEAREIAVSYTESRLDADFTLVLTDDGSAIDETFVVTALEDDLQLRLYLYVDFALDRVPSTQNDPDDSARIVGGDTLIQTDALTIGTVSIMSPPPDAFQVGLCCSIEDAIDRSGMLLDLDGTASVNGPADLEAAFSWDFDLDRGESFEMTLRKSIALVPEPSTASMVGLGLLGLVAARRRRPFWRSRQGSGGSPALRPPGRTRHLLWIE